jgi:vacuolar-type H+-ATPase subunit H
MKEAILIEAKQRAHTLVENANEEADQERAKIYNLEKEKIQHEFTILTKAEKIKEKM